MIKRKSQFSLSLIEKVTSSYRKLAGKFYGGLKRIIAAINFPFHLRIQFIFTWFCEYSGVVSRDNHLPLFLITDFNVAPFSCERVKENF